MSKKHPKFPSELRLDLINKDWVVIATGRAKKPESFRQEKRVKLDVSEKDCPFCDFKEKKNLISSLNNTFAVRNKYPAFLPYPSLEKKTEGRIYQKMNAVGFSEVVATRDHKKHFPHFELNQVKEVFDVYQQRYLVLMKEKFVNYVSIFHNHGQEAGASQPHPHSQIITTPLIDVDLQRALFSSESYFQEKGECVYCRMNKWEKRAKKRIVFENEGFRAVCPFASKAAFEVIISPQKHLPYWEKTTDQDKWQLAECFQKIMQAFDKGLADPAYNFYLHTAPCDGENYDFYHWHWTIIPKTAVWAGFELGSGMEISTIEPERAATYLRKQLK